MKLTAGIGYQTLNLLIVEVSRKMPDGFDPRLALIILKSLEP